MRRFLVPGLVALCAAGAGLGIGLTIGSDDDATTTGPAGEAILAAGEADIGFLQDMSDHHGQAVLLSSHLLSHGANPVLMNMARNILGTQAQERGQMAALLADRGAPPGAPDRVAMSWMPEEHWCSVEDMPGMIPQEELNEFLGLRGAELDQRFAELMLRHHQGGIFMAESAVDRVTDPRIESLARAIVVDQREEIADLERLLAGT